MNRDSTIFFGILLALAVSWLGTVEAPRWALGLQEAVTLEETGQLYPAARPGQARQGAEVYRANGCVHCHTRQVQAPGPGLDKEQQWGPRRTVARDYLYDQPVMLGRLRLGPDLANLGLRQTNAHQLLLRLYDPRLVQPASPMPPHPFLFKTRQLQPGRSRSPDALVLPPGHLPTPGEWEVLPASQALALVSYLQSLRADAMFFEVLPPLPPKRTGPVAPPTAATSSPPANLRR